MEIKNKNIFLNLKEGEEILYIAPKSKFEFYMSLMFSLFCSLPCALFFTIIAIVGQDYLETIWRTLIMVLWLIFVLFFIYACIRDYCFTELIITNQRFIISRFNKLSFIEHNQIKTILGISSFNGKAFSYSTIKLKSKKPFIFFFINNKKLMEKFLEIYPEYHNENNIIKPKTNEKDLKLDLQSQEKLMQAMSEKSNFKKIIKLLTINSEFLVLPALIFIIIVIQAILILSDGPIMSRNVLAVILITYYVLRQIVKTIISKKQGM